MEVRKKIRISENRYEYLTYEELLKLYENYIHKLAFKFSGFEDIEDLKQIIHLRIYKCFENYNEERDIGFGHYMNQYTYNEVRRYVRDKTNFRRKEGARDIDYNFTSIHQVMFQGKDGIDITYEDSIIDNNAENEDNIIDRIFLKEALDELDEKQRKIVNLYFYENMNQIIIAEKMNISQVQVSRLLKKAMITLKNYMMKGEEDMSLAQRRLESQRKKQAFKEFLDKNKVYNTQIIKEYSKESGVNYSTLFSYLRDLRNEGYEYQLVPPNYKKDVLDNFVKVEHINDEKPKNDNTPLKIEPNKNEDIVIENKENNIEISKKDIDQKDQTVVAEKVIPSLVEDDLNNKIQNNLLSSFNISFLELNNKTYDMSYHLNNLNKDNFSFIIVKENNSISFNKEELKALASDLKNIIDNLERMI